MLLPEGTISTLDGTTLIPIDITGRFMQRAQTVSIVELGKRLLKAARDGETEQVRELMGKGAPFTSDWLGTSPLHFAALNNHLETCEVLLRAGISRDSRTKVDRTPLHMAAYEGHNTIVHALLTNNAEVDPRDMLKMTPLHWAVQNGHADCVTLLLRSGANSEAVNKFDKTPYDIALETNRLDILQLLQVVTKDPIVAEAAESLAIELDPEDIDISEDISKPEYLIDEEEVEEIEDDETNLPEDFETQHLETDTENSNSNVDLSDSIQMLKDHGISFLPADNSSVVASAVENGHSLVLTEVGKQVLNSTKPLVKMPVQKTHITKIKGRKVITVTADQLLAMATSSTNVFRKVPINSTDKPIKRIVMNKNKIILSGTPNMIKRMKPEPQQDLERMTRELAETKRQMEEYKQIIIYPR
ncbi:Ada2a-containing complex component 3 [Carabus blaptoides fortunei]